MKFCPKCGAKIQDERKFCTSCGNVLEDAKTSSANENTENNNNLGDTVKINLNKKDNNYSNSVDNNAKNTSQNNYLKNNTNKYNNIQVNESTKKGKNTKIIIGSICGFVIIIGVIIGVFFNTIRANYYMSKCSKSYITQEKLDYAEKAIICSKNNKTKAFVKQIFSTVADSDIDAAEKKLEGLSHILDQNDYKEIAGEVKNKKLDKIYSQGQYEEALALFKDIDSLGGDFKKSSHYEDIMFNVISRVTGRSLENSKNALMEEQKICFDNFDNDAYDEIMEVTGGEYYGEDIKINLYKYSDGQYRQVDTKLVNNCWFPEMCGVYNYDKDTNGMYLRYNSDDGEEGIGVFDVDEERVQLKGAVLSNNYTKPDDINNDGIYEVLSNSTSMFSYSSKGVSKWYKINADGSEPSEINGNVKNDSSSSNKQYSNDLSELKNTDYLFPQSSSEFLTDDDLKNLSKSQLAIARNEIFARHGYVFNMQEYADYFNGKSWYTPNSNYDGSIETLNKYEKANVELIKEYEAK